jgi:hypothetical protein
MCCNSTDTLVNYEHTVRERVSRDATGVIGDMQGGVDDVGVVVDDVGVIVGDVVYVVSEEAGVADWAPSLALTPPPATSSTILADPRFLR